MPDVRSAEQEILATMEATDEEANQSWDMTKRHYADRYQNHDSVDGATVTEDSPQHEASDPIEITDTDVSRL